jgi:S-formylglutathione hydrolase FrmB
MAVMRRGSRLAITVAVAMTAMASLLGSGDARANQLVTITIPDQHGEVPSQWLSYPGPPRADVLLPDGYNARKRYPLILNLGGLGGNYATAAFGTGLHIHAIVVTPEPGSGWYTDWWNNGRRGDPAWESYYLNEVIPTILARYRILPQRRYHAIVGISMGGLGAAYLGGRLPGFFGSVASLSGFVDPQYFAAITGEGMGLTAIAPLHGDYDLYPVDGPPNGFYAIGHNPPNLAMNLEQTRVFESTGTGVPSSAGLKDPTVIPVGSLLESLIIYPMNQVFHQAAAAAGVDVTYQVHPGGHDAPDFANEITAMLAWGLFKPVVTNPRAWVNDTVATDGQLWDITYSFAQPPDQVVQFRRAGNSLSISAAGSAVTITTSGGCAINTGTPATVRIPQRSCRRKRRR